MSKTSPVNAQVILDLETMSTDQDGVILSIGLLFIRDSDIDKSIEELAANCLSIKLDAKEQLKAGRTTSKDVMAFWEKQSKEARAVIRPSIDDFKAADAWPLIEQKIQELNIDISNNSTTQVWQRGDMDFRMINDYFKDFGFKESFEQYFDWRKVRDIRTFTWTINLINYGAYNKYSVPCDEAVEEATSIKQNWWDYVRDFSKEHNLVAHDAVSDCLIQAEQLRILGMF